MRSQLLLASLLVQESLKHRHWLPQIVVAVLWLLVRGFWGVLYLCITHNWLTAAKVLGLLVVIGVGLVVTTDSPPPVAVTTESSFGLAMVFVLLSYGGWNEAAYISADTRNVQRNMVRSLVWSIGIISAIYLLINLAYLRGLGLSGTAGSEAVAADLMRRAFGTPGAVFISLLIAISTLGATNATIFTGARTNYALGQDFAQFKFLSKWRKGGNTPVGALLVQGAFLNISINRNSPSQRL